MSRQMASFHSSFLNFVAFCSTSSSFSPLLKIGRLAQLVVVITLLSAATGLAGPIVKLGRNVPRDQSVPLESIDHAAWDVLLHEYVNGSGSVDYQRWKNDQQQLDTYLNHLSTARFDPKASRDAQLAFWINAYNAVTVKGILREYPTTSIRNHTSELFGYNIWKDLQLIVESKPYSLDAMEHTVLRKMGEPRIHFAIVCASQGCPRLLNEAYVADRLDSQLATNAKAFFADQTKFSVDAMSEVIHVSPILKWFAKDFGDDSAAQMKTISTYVPDSARSLVNSGRARVKYHNYDWNLNDQAKKDY